MTTQGRLIKFVPYLSSKEEERMTIDKSSVRDRDFLSMVEV